MKNLLIIIVASIFLCVSIYLAIHNIKGWVWPIIFAAFLFFKGLPEPKN
jgi:hypothetical protein